MPALWGCGKLFFLTGGQIYSPTVTGNGFLTESLSRIRSDTLSARRLSGSGCLRGGAVGGGVRNPASNAYPLKKR